MWYVIFSMPPSKEPKKKWQAANGDESSCTKKVKLLGQNLSIILWEWMWALEDEMLN